MGAKKPAILVWREKDLPLYKMFIEEDCDILRFDVAQSDLNAFFLQDVTLVGNTRVICPTFRIAESMKIDWQKGLSVNFVSTILRSMGLHETEKCVTNLPKISSSIRHKAEVAIASLTQGRPYVLLCPEANSLKNLPGAFWKDLSQKFIEKGFFVFVNALDASICIENTVAIHCPIDELYVYAQNSARIVSMASGLGVLLSTSGNSCDLIYTDFVSRSIGYDSTMVKDIYSVKHLPSMLIRNSIVREWDAKYYSEEKLTEMLMQN